MKTLAAQPASASVLHLYGDFASNAPGKLATLKGVKGAYLVPQVSSDSRRCLVIESAIAVSPACARLLKQLVERIGAELGYSAASIQLVRAVERRTAGRLAHTIHDWVKLR